ncbi:MAG: beta-galactosidase, partial [Longimicrobiales bacterium]|nr:beta-galactosidase [Longimicrobiales bacterium]
MSIPIRLRPRSALRPAAPALAVLVAACAAAGPTRPPPADAGPSAGSSSAGVATPSPTGAVEAPRIVERDGRYALLVDGEPYLMLVAQANNSSNYPAALPALWAAAEDLHANTIQMPIAWAQVEPVEGEFDFSFVDTLLEQARAR